MFAQTPAADIRTLREEMPANMATVCFKAVEKLLKASETGCSTQQEQQTGREVVCLFVCLFVCLLGL